MINSNSIYTSFRQTYNSCVLAAFSISCHAFNRRVTPQKFFKLFCLHFDDKLLSLANEISEENLFWEKQYVLIFNTRLAEYQISGNTLIKHFFDESQENLIKECRSLFSVDYVEQAYLSAQKLIIDEAVLSASYQLATGSYHSIAIGFDSTNNCYCFVDTNTPDAIQGYNSEHFKVLGDGLYLKKI